MAIAFVQEEDGHNSGTTSCNTTVTATGSGNLIVIMVGFENSGGGTTSITGCTDDKGSIYVQAASAAQPTAGQQTDIWYTTSSIAGATTVTVNFANSANADTNIYEFSGADPSPFVTATAFNQTAPPVSPALNVTITGMLMLASGYPASVALTGVDAPFTGFGLSPNTAGETGYVINPTIGSTTCVFDPHTSQNISSSAILFKAPASGPSNATKTGMFLVF